ncbi:MAG: hypothetical protein JWP80_1901 [Pseudomonas sp.]|nr:hypothetical protein [Pseudomonas sp.]
MNNFSLKAAAAACCALTLGVALNAQAAPVMVTVTVINDTPGDLSLTAANWSLGNRPPSDFKIATESEANFGLPLKDSRKGKLEFNYSSGTQTCKFIAEHGIKESFGWFTSTKTPYQAAHAKSVGSFPAVCEAELVSNKPGEGYEVLFSME